MTHSVSRSGLGLCSWPEPPHARCRPRPPPHRRCRSSPEASTTPATSRSRPTARSTSLAAGKAGGQCVGPRREPTCIGYSGKIWALTPGSGAKRVVQAGLLSLGGQDGTFTVGPDGVAVAPDGALYTIIASGTPRDVGGRAEKSAGAGRRAVARAAEAADRRRLDRQLRVETQLRRRQRRHQLRPVRRARARRRPPDRRRRRRQRDPGGERQNGETARGRSEVPAEPSACRPRSRSAPTATSTSASWPRAPGTGRARVLKIPQTGGTPTVVATGFTAITGLAFGSDGSMYVTELSTNLRSQSAPGRITRIKPDGSRTSFSRGLFFPQGAAVAGQRRRLPVELLRAAGENAEKKPLQRRRRNGGEGERTVRG